LLIPVPYQTNIKIINYLENLKVFESVISNLTG